MSPRFPRSTAGIAVLVPAFVLLVALLLRAGLAPAPRTSPSVTPAPSASFPATPAPAGGFHDGFGASVGFHSQELLLEHFQKHGAEFDASSPQEYLRMAQGLRDRKAGGDVIELRRDADGVLCRFERSTGAFLAFNPDGVIRTYFRPNDGENYFRRQALRSH